MALWCGDAPYQTSGMSRRFVSETISGREANEKVCHRESRALPRAPVRGWD